MGATAQALKGATPTEEQAKSLEDMLMGAYDDLKKARATDDGKWGKKVDVELAKLNFGFKQSGLAALNMTYDKGTSPETKKEAYQSLVDLMNLSIEIDATDYFPFDMRAQGKLGLADSVGARIALGAGAPAAPAVRRVEIGVDAQIPAHRGTAPPDETA